MDVEVKPYFHKSRAHSNTPLLPPDTSLDDLEIGPKCGHFSCFLDPI